MTALKHLVIVLDSYDWNPSDHYPVRLDPAEASRLRKRAEELKDPVGRYGEALAASSNPRDRRIGELLKDTAALLSEVEQRLGPRPDL